MQRTATRVLTNITLTRALWHASPAMILAQPVLAGFTITVIPASPGWPFWQGISVDVKSDSTWMEPSASPVTAYAIRARALQKLNAHLAMQLLGWFWVEQHACVLSRITMFRHLTISATSVTRSALPVSPAAAIAWPASMATTQKL